MNRLDEKQARVWNRAFAYYCKTGKWLLNWETGMNDKTKELIDNLIYDLDRHFPYELHAMDNFHQEFYNDYIKPINESILEE